ncbi:MAG: DR2241 family protein [Chloroflexi bacterium]|nr:DR2241 family protein [Chloroflexota bacterium]
MSGSALILAGHGSHISANTAGTVWNYVDRLRSWGVADEVTACFWKETPTFSQVLDTVVADEVVIVPVFTARGYFTGEVLPTELGISGNSTQRNGRHIHVTQALGEGARLQSIVERRLEEALSRYQLRPADTAAAIIGHGTRRNRASRETAQQQARRIRDLNWFGEVVAVFLDDEPDIASVYRTTRAANIIALPYFLAEGSHVRVDVPRALGIKELDAVNHIDGRSVYYCEAVGTDASICRVILDLARAAGPPFAARKPPGAWSGFPLAGRSALIQALESEKMLQIGQVKVSRRRVWHCDNSADCAALPSAAALRAFLRADPFRPLATSTDLPAGWEVTLDSAKQAHAVIETIYPGLIADWAAHRRGSLKTESLRELGRRQSGMFKDIHLLPQSVIKTALTVICGNCVRQPTWWREFSAPARGLPCRAACNLWLSGARKMGNATL